MIYTKSQVRIIDNTEYIIDEDSGELRQILVDCSATGKKHPFARNKQQNLYLSEVYQYIAKTSSAADNTFLDCACSSIDFSKTFNKLTFCSNYLEFAHLKDKS